MSYPITKIEPGQILEGALYALRHALELIEDAKLLHEHRRFSSAFVLVVFAREELGRHQILLEQFRATESSGSMEVKKLRGMLNKHVAKLKYGQQIITVPIRPETLERLRHMTEEPPGIARLKEDFEKLHEHAERKRKRQPLDLHKRRKQALYVDLLSNGSWSLPSSISDDQSRQIICIVAAEYCNCVFSFQDSKWVSAYEQYKVTVNWSEFDSSIGRAIKCIVGLYDSGGKRTADLAP